MKRIGNYDYFLSRERTKKAWRFVVVIVIENAGKNNLQLTILNVLEILF